MDTATIARGTTVTAKVGRRYITGVVEKSDLTPCGFIEYQIVVAPSGGLGCPVDVRYVVTELQIVRGF